MINAVFAEINQASSMLNSISKTSNITFYARMSRDIGIEEMFSIETSICTT